MEYRISQLLEDRELQKRVMRWGLTVQDSTGQFAFLDFSRSVQENHRAVFDRLCLLGGERLLDKLKKEDNTRLVCNTGGNHHGMYPIQGTDKYLLEADVSASTGLGSILNGLAGWLEDAGQPEDIITFHIEGDGNKEPPAPPPRRLSPVQRDGKYVFF